MKVRKHRILSAFLAVVMAFSLLLSLMLSISGEEIPFTGEAEKYFEELMAQGFPEDYAVSLTKLHLLHPNWSFSPLDIAQANADYTWNYVIQQEIASPSLNLVSAQKSYEAYWHPSNRELFDSGYYQPSVDAVRYFMDPRNFLNEADLFQFYDLSADISASAEDINAILAGTFMENKLLQNGKTYTEYLLEIEDEIGISALYLAVKLRQEQGVAGTSPIISGACGDKLWEFYSENKQTTDSGSPINPPESGETEAELKALNGLYNPFNINASGNGVFTIYKKAMQYAQKGSASMSEEWGGSPSWNTDWKGIYGGALFIKEKYIDRYQSTFYLQKFDVDSRSLSGNFQNQYMQNLMGALSEGRSFYRAFATNDHLDTACHFLIPVYRRMPANACKDPANGTCASYATATARYETEAQITSPLSAVVKNDAIYGSVEVESGAPITVSGTMSHSYGVVRLEYSLNGGPWISCSNSGALELSISEDLSDLSEGLFLIRGEAAYNPNESNRRLNRYFLCAVLQINVTSPSYTVTLQTGDEVSSQSYKHGDEVTLPAVDTPDFAGWLGSNGSLIPSGGKITVEQDLTFTAIRAELQTLKGAAISLSSASPHLRFTAVIPEEQYQKLLPFVSYSAAFTYNGQSVEVTPSTQRTVTANDGTLWRRIVADTPNLSQKDLQVSFQAAFSMTLRYSNGTSKTLVAVGEPTARSADQVARAALADTQTAYSAQSIGYLQAILP